MILYILSKVLHISVLPFYTFDVRINKMNCQKSVINRWNNIDELVEDRWVFVKNFMILFIYRDEYNSTDVLLR